MLYSTVLIFISAEIALPQRRPGDEFERAVRASQALGGTGFQGRAQGVAAQVHH